MPNEYTNPLRTPYVEEFSREALIAEYPMPRTNEQLLPDLERSIAAHQEAMAANMVMISTPSTPESYPPAYRQTTPFIPTRREPKQDGVIKATNKFRKIRSLVQFYAQKHRKGWRNDSTRIEAYAEIFCSKPKDLDIHLRKYLYRHYKEPKQRKLPEWF